MCYAKVLLTLTQSPVELPNFRSCDELGKIDIFAPLMFVYIYGANYSVTYSTRLVARNILEMGGEIENRI